MDGPSHPKEKVFVTAPPPHPIWKIGLQSKKPFLQYLFSQ
jgi:hypothetical protein